MPTIEQLLLPYPPRKGPPKRKCASRMCLGSGWVVSWDTSERHCRECIRARTASLIEHAKQTRPEPPTVNLDDIPF